MGKMGGMTVVILFVLAVATLTTNRKDMVAPANGFSNLNPTKISFKMAATSPLALVSRSSPGNCSKVPVYIFTWLIGYSALPDPSQHSHCGLFSCS